MKGKEWFAAMAFGLLVIVSIICSTLNNDAVNAVILQGLAYIGTAGLAVIVIKCMGRLFQGTFSNPYWIGFSEEYPLKLELGGFFILTASPTHHLQPGGLLSLRFFITCPTKNPIVGFSFSWLCI